MGSLPLQLLPLLLLLPLQLSIKGREDLQMVAPTMLKLNMEDHLNQTVGRTNSTRNTMGLTQFKLGLSLGKIGTSLPMVVMLFGTVMEGGEWELKEIRVQTREFSILSVPVPVRLVSLLPFQDFHTSVHGMLFRTGNIMFPG